MKKNRLQDCPEGIGSLSRLKRLELDGKVVSLAPSHQQAKTISRRPLKSKNGRFVSLIFSRVARVK